MKREKLIALYESMMYSFGEFDIWDDDIFPKLSKMSTKEIERKYLADKAFYEERNAAGGYFG